MINLRLMLCIKLGSGIMIKSPMRQFILISKTLRLFMFNIWNWVFGLIVTLSWIVDDLMKWASDYSGEGLMFSVVASCAALAYSLIVDWLNYGKASTIYNNFNREEFGVQHFLETGFKETVHEYMKEGTKDVSVTRFESALSKYVTNKLEKYKAAERSVWGD